MPDELKQAPVKRKKRKVRRRKKKAPTLSGLPGLQAKAVSDLELMTALKEMHWCESITRKAVQQVSTRQEVCAESLPPRPLGFKPRAGTEYHLDLGLD